MSDTLIVGAGIGGGVLALALAQRGWRVTIVEREAKTPRHVRPEILWGATIAALDRLGVGAIARERSVQLEGVDLGGLVTITADDLRAAGTEAWSIDPSAFRAGIVEAALATGLVEVQHGVAVDTVRRDAGRVAGVAGLRGTERVELGARLVVGNDGVHSVVRRSIGVELDPKLFPVDFVTAAIRWPPELPPRRARAWIHPAATRTGIPLVGCFPWPKGAGVLLVPLMHERADARLQGGADDFWRALAATAPIAERLRGELEFPRDFTRVRRPYGQAARYVDDGAAILGDAAHPMSPVGGQGANAAIADALALADVAEGALRAGDVSRERLDAYVARRWESNRRSVGFTRAAVRVLATGGWLPLPRLLPVLARTGERLGWPKRRLLRTISTAFLDARS